MLSGTVTAPMRAAASQPTTKSGPFGCSSPTCVPLPAPVARRPRASVGRARVGLGVGERCRRRRSATDGRRAAARSRRSDGDGQRQAVAGVDDRRSRHVADPPRRHRSGRSARSPGDRLHRRLAQQRRRRAAAEPVDVMRSLVDRALDLERERGQQRASAGGTRRAATSSCRPRRHRSCGAGPRSRRRAARNAAVHDAGRALRRRSGTSPCRWPGRRRPRCRTRGSTGCTRRCRASGRGRRVRRRRRLARRVAPRSAGTRAASARSAARRSLDQRGRPRGRPSRARAPGR